MLSRLRCIVLIVLDKLNMNISSGIEKVYENYTKSVPNNIYYFTFYITCSLILKNCFSILIFTALTKLLLLVMANENKTTDDSSDTSSDEIETECKLYFAILIIAA